MQDISIHKFSYWVKLSFAIICFPCGFWVGGGWGLFQGGGHLQPCGRVFYSIYGHHRGCLNNPCWARFMCHHELWPTSVSHPFSFLNSSLGLAGGKHYQKITIPIFRLVLQNFLLIFFSIAIFSPCFLQVGLLLQYGTVSARELVKS